MAGLAGIKTKTNSFKSVEINRSNSKAQDIKEFINNAEGETSNKNKKMGAPFKSEQNKRSYKLAISFTQQERESIQKMAEQKSMNITEFIRYKIFNAN